MLKVNPILSAFICISSAVGLVGCDESGTVESFLQEKLAQDIPGLQIQTIECPDDLKIEVGNKFDCEVTVPEGKFKEAVTVQSKESEQVTYTYQNKGMLILSEVEKQIQEGIKQQSKIEATADCGSSQSPIRMFKKAGEAFECKVSLPNAKKANAKVTMKTETDIEWEMNLPS